jgi:hypothetical protein
VCLFSVFLVTQFNLQKYCRYLSFRIELSKILVEQLSMSAVIEQNDMFFYITLFMLCKQFLISVCGSVSSLGCFMCIRTIYFWIRKDKQSCIPTSVYNTFTDFT